MLKTVTRKTFAAVAASVVLFGATPAFAEDANNSTYAPVFNRLFENETAGQNTELATSANGLERTAYYAVTDASGTEYASNYANASRNYAWSIVDIDRAQSMKLRLVYTNPTDTAVSFSEYAYCMPGDHDPSVCGDVKVHASEFATVIADTGAAGLNVTYQTTGSTTYADQATVEAAGGSAQDVVAMRIAGTVEPGQTVTIDVPLNITDDLKLDTWPPTWYEVREIRAQKGDSKLNVRFHFAHRFLDADGKDVLTNTGKYIAVIRDRNDSSKFTTAPAEIQSVIANQQLSDFTTIGNSLNIYYHNVDPAADASDNDPWAVFSYGTYDLNLANVKKSLEGTGWSVNSPSDSVSELADSYRYQYNPQSSVTIADAETGEQVAADGSEGLSRVHVEVFQYIDAHDVTLNVGDEFNIASALDWIRKYDEEVFATGETENLEQVLADNNVEVTSDVDTSKAGEYDVTFTLKLDDGETVSKTVKVTVKAAAGADDNGADDNKDTTVIPFPIPVPVPAGGSSGSSQAGTPAQNTPAQATSAQVAPAQPAQTGQKASRGVLANTGASTGLAVAVAAALLAAGGALLLRTRRNG